MQFTKMHGTGNDYIYVNAFEQNLPGDLKTLAQKISHRRFGVGADGLIVIHPSDSADARMQMFNADGSEAEMCGNGIRCVARYVYDRGIAKKDSLAIETGAGNLPIEMQLENGEVTGVRVNMGQPRLKTEQIPTSLEPAEGMAGIVDQPLEIDGVEWNVSCVSMGNPHCVIFVPEITDEMVLGVGPKIEQDKRFPKRTNVEFVKVLSKGEAVQRTWERGSGETWACGTGASAVCVAGVLSGNLDRTVKIQLLGGELHLEWDEVSNNVFMTGPAAYICDGKWTE